MASNLLFTADTHFNHTNIVASRPEFASLEEMNEALVSRWNARVKRGDRVYHLGDVALWKPADAVSILKRLNGQIHLVKGNHDRVATHKDCRDRFASIRSIDSLNVGGQHVVMCHYAMRAWDRCHYGSWQIYGHSHGRLEALPGVKQFDVGVDCWGFAPVSLDEVAAKMATIAPLTPTHAADLVE